MTDLPSRDTSHRPHEVRFSPAIVLSKSEAFEACEVCAEAERALVRSGRLSEAGRLAELFTFIEERLVQSGPDPTVVSVTLCPTVRSRGTTS